jgi:hypothetical protein
VKHAGIAACAALALAACVPQTFSFEDVTMYGLGLSDAAAADVEPASDATTASDTPASTTPASTTPASNTQTSDAQPASDAATASDANAETDGRRPPPRKDMDASAGANPDANPLPDCANDPACSRCSVNADCSKGSLPVCDMTSFRCVGCLMDSDCPADGRWFCLAQRCVAGCSGDAMSCGEWQCIVDAGSPGFCSDCVTDADCDGHQMCNGGLCVECVTDNQCHGNYCSKNGYCVQQSP